MKALALLCVLCFAVILTAASQHTYIFDAAKQPYYRNATLGFGYMNVLYHPKSKLEVPKENILQLHALNYSNCLIACTRNLSCFSVNFGRQPVFIYQGKVRYLCELLPMDKYNFSSNYQINNQEFDHYSIKTDCSKSPCLHNFSCIPNYMKDTYECLCPRPPYKGKHCDEDLACNFEVDMCAWTPYPQRTFLWHRIQGATSSIATGPTGDATASKNRLGYYIYTEASNGATGDIAELRSPVISATFYIRCLKFAYHMYGSSMGTLKVYKVYAATGTKSLLFSKSGDQGQNWHREQITITSSSDYKIVFEVTKGSSYLADVALDDIVIDHGICT